MARDFAYPRGGCHFEVDAETAVQLREEITAIFHGVTAPNNEKRVDTKSPKTP
jgi:hypothetical protein